MPECDRTKPKGAPRLAILLPLTLSLGIALLPYSTKAAEGTERVTVFAAASLADALNEIFLLFEAETGIDVTLSVAGSAALARQIRLGAPADLFLSADPHWTDLLEDEGLIEPGRRHNLLGNRLVLIGHGADGPPAAPISSLDLDDILGSGRLAIGLTEAVPAGRYGVAALRATGLWPAAEARLAETDNVRAALALVATGAAPAGIVYATDAIAEPRVHILAEFEPQSHPPIIYPLADLSGAESPSENELYDFLLSREAKGIFQVHGFTSLVHADVE